MTARQVGRLGARLGWGFVAWGWLACVPVLAAEPPSAALPRLELIESYYREGDAYRAETEVLRFLHDHPDHPRRPEVELARAKLYYRAGRYEESSLMLFSQLDRYPDSEAAAEASRLLALSLVREERLDQAEEHLPALARRGGPRPTLAALRAPSTEAVDPETAVAWSTWLPGAGFFTVGEPAKAAAGIGLNLFFTGAAVAAFQAEQRGLALLLLLVEVALYRGGREAARDAAIAHNERLRLARKEVWLREHGEPELLAVGLRITFGAP